MCQDVGDVDPLDRGVAIEFERDYPLEWRRLAQR